MPFGLVAPKSYLASQPFNLIVLNEGYPRNAPCALNLISPFVLTNGENKQQKQYPINSFYIIFFASGVRYRMHYH